MAERISGKNYKAMIQGLYNFMGRTGTLASELQTLSLVASSALGEEDTAVPIIYQAIKNASLKYAELTEIAKHIAENMNEELQRAAGETALWAED